MRLSIISFILLIYSTTLSAQIEGYRTVSISDDIASLKVTSSSGFLYPTIIPLNGNEFIDISFDLFGDEHEDLSYSIYHCNADWRRSGLSMIEYMDGWDMLDVDIWDLSFNTHLNYTNYNIQIPNEDVSLKVSGNYVVMVYPQNSKDEPLLYACFSVAENRVGVECAATARTDKGHLGDYQQVSATINIGSYEIRNPTTDLKVYVSQNNRIDNKVQIETPLYFNNREIVYKHIQDMIFEAGNEYNRFETTSTRYMNMGVEKIQFFDPVYHATLVRDIPRKNRSYTYDETQHGRYLIRDSDNDEDSFYMANYLYVHFSLDTKGVFIPDGNIYIDGEFTENRFTENNRMVLNPKTNLYEKAILLKQGSYNYQYLYVPNNGGKPITGFIDGNKYETVNEYRVDVYHRVPGERYDRFIGWGWCLTDN